MSSVYDVMKTPDSFKDLGVNIKYSVINLQKQVTSQIESFSSIIKSSEDPARKASSDDFINSIKDTKEYDLGIYEVGRYAWILDDIEPIDKIKAKGKLNIWEYKGDEKNEL